MFSREVGTTSIRGISDKNKAEIPSKKTFFLGGGVTGRGQDAGAASVRRVCVAAGRGGWVSGVRGGNNAGGGQRGREACGGNKKSSFDVVTQEGKKMVA